MLGGWAMGRPLRPQPAGGAIADASEAPREQLAPAASEHWCAGAGVFGAARGWTRFSCELYINWAAWVWQWQQRRPRRWQRRQGRLRQQHRLGHGRGHRLGPCARGRGCRGPILVFSSECRAEMGLSPFRGCTEHPWRIANFADTIEVRVARPLSNAFPGAQRRGGLATRQHRTQRRQPRQLFLPWSELWACWGCFSSRGLPGIAGAIWRSTRRRRSSAGLCSAGCAHRSFAGGEPALEVESIWHRTSGSPL
mmetsp:Transcript_174332/g.558848  ORF Transcript_174332/g.558848 Transcript_174332/m.558848 type:complete len:252 (-) Transcript_174332:380-1135(-)